MQGLSSGMTALVHSETASLISVLLTFLTHSHLQVWLAPTKGGGGVSFSLDTHTVPLDSPEATTSTVCKLVGEFSFMSFPL